MTTMEDTPQGVPFLPRLRTPIIPDAPVEPRNNMEMLFNWLFGGSEAGGGTRAEWGNVPGSPDWALNNFAINPLNAGIGGFNWLTANPGQASTEIRPPAAGASSLPVPPAVQRDPNFDPTRMGQSAPSPGGFIPSPPAYVPTPIPAAPQIQPNPAMQGMVDYLRQREERLRPYFDDTALEIDRTLRPQSFWDRLWPMLGAVAARGDLSQAGDAAWDLRREGTDRRIQAREALRRLGMEEAGLGDQTQQAVFNQQTQEWETQNRNTQNQYNVDVGNVNQQNEAGRFNAQQQHQFRTQTGAAQYEAAMEEFRRQRARTDEVLGALTGGQGPGAYAASEELMRTLPRGVQQAQEFTMQRNGLQQIIQNAATLSGNNERRAANNIVTQMNAMARGQAIQHMPRGQLARLLRNGNFSAITDFYARQGVLLQSPEIRNNYPGLNPQARAGAGR